MNAVKCANPPRRTRGAKPQNPDDQAARVAAAVRALERIGAAFTVADVAERAGLSRATIYRRHELRALVGAKGDGPRWVAQADHDKLLARHAAMKSKARALRRDLTELEQSWHEMRERALKAERQAREAEQKASPSAPAAGVSPASLAEVAGRLGPDAVRQARRQLARGLHPDLFPQDSAAAALASELLKALNALTDRG